jgi:hypothetical protein
VARQLLERFELDAPVRLIGVGLAGLVSDGAEEDERAKGPGRAASDQGDDPAGPLTLDVGAA